MIMRRMDAEITVVTGAGEGPLAFIWRGRSYAVQEVLADWCERRPWWRTVLDGPTTPGDLEERVWRVAASPGRAAATGVFELGHGRGWRLLRVAD